MNEREALKLALEALEWNYNTDLDNIHACEKWAKMLKENIAAIREALALSESSTKCEETSHAQPEQICGFDVVLDESMPPNTFKLAQPDYRAMYLKVRDELAELQQRSEK